MKRALVSSLAAVFLAAGMVASVAAAPSSGSITVAACFDTVWSELKVTTTWANQTPVAGDLVLTLTFKGKKLTNILPLNFGNPVNSSGFSPILISNFPGTDPDLWTTIDASMTGYFVDSARAIRQPRGGWADC